MISQVGWEQTRWIQQIYRGRFGTEGFNVNEADGRLPETSSQAILKPVRIKSVTLVRSKRR